VSDRPRAPWGRFVVVALLVVLDLVTKAWIFGLVGPWESGAVVPPEAWERDHHGHGRLVLVESWFALMRSENPGAAFGQLGSFPHALVGGRVLAVLLLGWLLWRTERTRPWQLAAFVLILSGALGNLYDNLFLDVPGDGHPYGLVRDWIDVYFTRWDYHFPTFNVADACITVGAVLLLLTGFGKEPEPEAAEEPEAPREAAA
jgi:signal peptidase II